MAAAVMSAPLARALQGGPGSGPRLQRARPRPVPLQRVPAAGNDRARPARHSDADPVHRGFGAAAGPPQDRRRGARPGARDRHDRKRQEHDARGDDRLHQPPPLRPRDDGRGPDRVPPPRPPVDHQPAGGRRPTPAAFAYALRSALRQDPDVILVGEMRDFETIETALLAAETGHLVFSTLHTLDATETINRIIAVFPPHQQKQVRLQLASVLKAVISQRLVPRADGTGPMPGRRGPDRHAVHPRLRGGQGEDAPHSGRDCRRHLPVRDADVRSVAASACSSRS